MSSCTVSRYNNLLAINEADELLNGQLAAANILRHDFLSLLAALFVGEKLHTYYSPCLLHKHYFLKEGEKMVADGNSTMPSTEIADDRVVAERWYPNGEEMEYRVGNQNISLPPPPAPDFMDKFKALTERYGVDVVGVCHIPPVEELTPDSVFLEITGVRDREQVVKMVPCDSLLDGGVYESCWVVTMEGSGPASNCRVVCAQGQEGCKPKPSEGCEY
ncbi:hypothetical protein CPC08DRAFT_105904 [Agrocybe pediades]|nr:hypothetical protein CPC08DRAFT_105904 [Agrocybe pediades]